MNEFYWINRVIVGDTLFGLSIWATGILAFLLASWARWPKWAKFLYFVTLSCGLMILAHYAIDALQNWWTTPLGPALEIER